MEMLPRLLTPSSGAHVNFLAPVYKGRSCHHHQMALKTFDHWRQSYIAILDEIYIPYDLETIEFDITQPLMWIFSYQKKPWYWESCKIWCAVYSIHSLDLTCFLF